jgi:hypothetical protein
VKKHLVWAWKTVTYLKRTKNDEFDDAIEIGHMVGIGQRLVAIAHAEKRKPQFRLSTLTSLPN